MKTKIVTTVGLLAVSLITLVSCKEDKSTPETKTETTDTTTSNSEVKLNPAHGQPGHRCDIAVGAPLNSPASINNNAASETTAKSPILNSNSNNTNALPASSNSGDVKINPAHGQPGHRCDIPVGQPLT